MKTFKIVLLGEGRVGKTSLFNKFIHNQFDPSEVTTIQAQYLEKELVVENQKVNLSIWDTAGQEKFRALSPIFYRKANGALLVYDTTDSSTLDRVEDWIAELRNILGDNVEIVIVGNKYDLKKKQQVDEEKALEITKSVNGEHFFSSAKTGKNVNEAFQELTKKMIKSSKNKKSKIKQKKSRRDFKIVKQEEKKKEGGCC
ncbi:ras-related protein rab-21 [Anaeramoeba flamelloides]|uniref:Ras-related protein rab-21 n=1 Tax=Anaeramoeba flamelloides TaxID=1746091 RepID=A0AAV7YUD9_9EUKA|nr:ras-related protein rab-21 [Anaeramoeba flamelloides]KAJ6253998.1 ras-related protein rab-21 [Anaeramoeba flamelloides]